MQANPRWEMTSGSLRLRVDHYALLRNMMLKVKGVPAVYLPMMYYPLSKDNRSTGFPDAELRQSSTYKGHTVSNAFFWAINRSQDATILHDWYSKTGSRSPGIPVHVARRGWKLPNEFPERAPHDLRGGWPGSRTGRTPRFGAYGNLSQSLGGRGTQGRAPITLRISPSISSTAPTSPERRNARGQLRQIDQRDGQGDPHHRHVRSQRIFRRELDVVGARQHAAHQRRSTGSAAPGLPVYASVTSEYLRIESKGSTQTAF